MHSVEVLVHDLGLFYSNIINHNVQVVISIRRLFYTKSNWYIVFAVRIFTKQINKCNCIIIIIEKTSYRIGRLLFQYSHRTIFLCHCEACNASRGNPCLSTRDTFS